MDIKIVRLIAKILSLILFVGSLAMLVIVTLVLRSGYNTDWVSALYEGFETIPEASLMMMGMHGSPFWVDVLYWVLVIIFLFGSWKKSG